MRIGVDATPLLGPKTGVGWYTAELIAEVADQAPEDEVLAFPISWRTARAIDIPVRPNLHLVRRIAPARPLWALWDRVAFPPLELFVKCDVFHATNYVAPPSWRVPVVVTVHDIGFVLRPEEVSPAIARMGQLLPKVLRRAQAVITVSEFTRDELASWLPEVASRITVVPNGSHSRTAPPAPAPAPVSTLLAGSRPYALMIGTLEPRKNVQLAVRALAILRSRGSELRLVLAGAPSPRLDIEALVRDEGLTGDDVVRTGYVDDDRMAQLLTGARLLAFPSRYEGFGMPLIEAMEAGVPVVAARAGAVPETVGDAAVLVDPDDAEGFAAAMEHVACDEDVRTSLIAAGRRRAERFTWRAAAAATLEVYRRVAR